MCQHKKSEGWCQHQDSTSPIYFTRLVIITSVIKAWGDWDVSVANTYSTYLDSEMDDKSFVKFRVSLVELLTLTEPKC